MKLGDVLPVHIMGKRVRRNCNKNRFLGYSHKTQEFGFVSEEGDFLAYLTKSDVSAEDWEILPEIKYYALLHKDEYMLSHKKVSSKEEAYELYGNKYRVIRLLDDIPELDDISDIDYLADLDKFD